MRAAKPLWKGLAAALALLVWCAPELGAQTKGQAKAPAKAPARAPAKAPAKAAPAPAAKAGGAAVAKTETVARRRDPFAPLVRPGVAGGKEEAQPTRPGKGGLVVGTIRVDGVVRASNGMIAVVSNPQNRVYFLREGDQLFNGSVERITMEGVAFRERGKDPFGNPLDRTVVKRLYPSAGEQR